MADQEKLLREKQVLLEQEAEGRRRVEEELRRAIEEGGRLRKEAAVLRFEKEKSMEIGLTEKIECEERNRLLEEEVKSKKQIVAALRKELEKAYSDREELAKRERAIEQKGRELECFSREVNEYNRLSEAKLRQRVQRLEQENDFLKGYVKKL